MTETAPLKLRGESREDLHVIAASLQDAIIPRRDIGYEPAVERFTLVASRFVWELSPSPDAPPPDRDADGNPLYYRVNAGLSFDQVRRVTSRNLDAASPGGMLALLTIDAAAQPDGAVTIDLIFAGDGAIRLEARRILCHLTDLSEPWPTPNRPEHRLAGDEAAEVAGGASDAANAAERH